MSELSPADQAHVRAATTAAMRGVRSLLGIVPQHVVTNILASIAMSCATSLALWIAQHHADKVESTRRKLLDAFDLGLTGGGEPLDDPLPADAQPEARLH